MMGEAHTRCPRTLWRDAPADLNEALSLYALFDKGVMLEDGAVMDQPNVYLDMMRVIGGAAAEMERYYMDKNKRAREAANKG